MVQNARGTRDYLPEDQIPRQKIISQLKEVFELFGFSPLDTPAIERFETLSEKYAGGEEILKEIFKLKDQGDRDLGLRFDLTVPLARVMAMNPELKMPFKRYHVDKVWRDGPVQRARFREFIQCDADVIGSASKMTDAEILRMIDFGFQKLGLKVTIKVNHILVLDGILAYAGVEKTQRVFAILALDKLEKIGEPDVRKEMKEKGISLESIDKVFDIMQMKGSNSEKLSHLHKQIKNEEEKKGIKEMEEILELCQNFENDLVFDLSLARGLSYYTGIVVEVTLVDSDVKSSVCGGGRYDKLISQMIGTEREYPAIGVSFGVDRIFEAINVNKSAKTVTQVLVVPIKVEIEATRIAMKLRKEGIKTEVAYGKNMSKALEYSNAMKIPYSLIIGERELKEDKMKLKNMETGEEKMISFSEIHKHLI